MRLLALFVIGALAGCGAKSSPEIQHSTVPVDGVPYHYRLAFDAHASGNPRPLVLAFHGTGETAESMASYSQLDELASKGFVIAYPEARNQSWLSEGPRLEANLRVFDALIEQIASEYSIDQQRIYAVGMSQGASFVHVLAHARSEQVSAIAAHSGSFLLSDDAPAPQRKYPVLLIHGIADEQVNVEESRSARTCYESWGHEVELVEVTGLGHAWATSAGATERIEQHFSQ